MGKPEPRPLGAPHNVVFICTYSEDEPLGEVLKAASMLDERYHIHITGMPPRTQEIRDVPGNVTLTGFLPDREYLQLLSSADALMTLTTCDHTLLCGAYEAVALSKPLILSDTAALRNYFKLGAVYIANDADSIGKGIQNAVRNRRRLTDEITRLRGMLMTDWNLRFQALMNEVEQ